MRRMLAVAAATAALGLAGCTESNGATSDPPAGTNQPSDGAAQTPAATPAEEQVATTAPQAEAQPEAAPESELVPESATAPTDDGVAPFGDSVGFEDDVEVAVAAPEAFEPSEFAAFTQGAAAYLAFTVTVVNRSEATIDTAGFYSTLQSEDTEMEEVFDPENGLSGSPATPLLPGREARFRIGYGVDNPDDLVLQVIPSFEHEGAIFTNTQ